MLDQETDEPHNCPESDWNSGKGGKGIDALDAMGNAITNLEDKMDELDKKMLKVILAVQTVQQRIEGQMPLFPSASDITTKEVSEPILDPARLTEEG